MTDTPNDPGAKPEPRIVIPPWMYEMGYEDGDEIADFDGFVCEVCYTVWDIEDSTCRDDEHGERVWLCPIHAGSGPGAY